MKKIFFVTALFLAFYSCETDFEVNAPYDKIPIVYGVLDQSLDTQFVKINKSFLGTNNLAYPSINDSLYFDNVNVKVEELDEDEGVHRVFSLQSKMVPVESGSGIFFTGQQRVYYFVPSSPLDETRDYRISGDGDGRKFSAKTNLIKSFDFGTVFKNANFLGGAKLYNAPAYLPIKPVWRQSPDAKLYDVAMRLKYKETRNGSTSNKYVEWFMGSRTSTNSGDLDLEVNAESFFVFLSNSSQLKDTSGVTKRVLQSIDYRVTSVNLILKTYIDVNKPNSAISFDRPDYTNIDGGRGIFASRYTVELATSLKDRKTVEHLCEGPYTSVFKFCSDNPGFSAESFYCP